jgi:hypothetical protein
MKAKQIIIISLLVVLAIVLVRWRLAQLITAGLRTPVGKAAEC